MFLKVIDKKIPLAAAYNRILEVRRIVNKSSKAMVHIDYFIDGGKLFA